MAHPPDPFSCEIDRRADGAIHLRLRGEFDLAAVERFEAAAASATSDGGAPIVLDLSGITFIDSSGLRGVLSLQTAAEERNLPFSVVPGPEPVRRVFELAGLAELLPVAQPPESGANGSSG